MESKKKEKKKTGDKKQPLTIEPNASSFKIELKI